MASPTLPWSWMNFPRTWSLCYPLQTAVCALTKGEKCWRNNTLLSELHSESILFIFLLLIFVLLQNAGGGESRWVGQTERRYWGISAGAQERAGQTGGRTSSTVLQVSSVLISPNWSMKQTYDYLLAALLWLYPCNCHFQFQFLNNHLSILILNNITVGINMITQLAMYFWLFNYSKKKKH